MNASNPLILCNDASTRAMGGVLMQVQRGREKPCVLVSHTLYEQATRWGVMEKELRFRLLSQESCQETFYSQNGPQELALPFKFDCAQIGQVEGSDLDVPFSDRSHPGIEPRMSFSQWIISQNSLVCTTRSTSTLEFVRAFLSWVGIFGLPKTLRSDGGSQFTSNTSPSTQRNLKVSAYCRSSLPSSGKVNGRAADEGGVDTYQSISV